MMGIIDITKDGRYPRRRNNLDKMHRETAGQHMGHM